MIYLISALIFSLLIIISFKLLPRRNISIAQAITVNYITAAILGFSTLGIVPSDSFFSAQSWSFTALISGIFLIVVFNIFALSTEKAGVAITAVSGKMSVVIPVILGAVIFNESIGVIKITGILLVLISFWLVFKKKEGYKLKPILIILPILLFLGNGINDSILKFAQYHYIRTDAGYVEFLTSAFSISFFFGIIILGIRILLKKETLHYKNIVAGMLLGILNWFSTLFFLKGLGQMNVSVFIPVFNAGLVSAAALVGLFIFKESLSKINVLGILFSIVAITLIAYAN